MTMLPPRSANAVFLGTTPRHTLLKPAKVPDASEVESRSRSLDGTHADWRGLEDDGDILSPFPEDDWP